jgi:hypothetical protein
VKEYPESLKVRALGTTAVLTSLFAAESQPH